MAKESIMTQPTFKICIVAHNAYMALAGDSSGHIGGVEKQTNLMAKWFAKQGHEVSVIVWQNEKPNRTVIDGVSILSVCRKDQGLRGVRFLYPRIISLVRALRQSDAEIFYHNCAEYTTGVIALWAKLSNRKFVYSVASDPECDLSLPSLNDLRSRVLFRVGIRLADCVITQTRTQKNQLHRDWSIKAIKLPMPSQKPKSMSTPRGDVFKVLWIGRVVRLKRLEWLVDVAKMLPYMEFHVVGGADSDDQYAFDVLQEAASLENVHVVGAVPFCEVEEFLSLSDVLCCTSEYEGFPNTFLEAWSHGLPIVSTFDPDCIVKDQSLGNSCDTVAQIIDGLSTMKEDRSHYLRLRANTMTYFDKNHSLPMAMQKFEDTFSRLVVGT